MKSIDAQPDFILYTGDFAAHQSPSEPDTFRAIADSVRALNEAFPGVKLYPTIGNDDMFPAYNLPLRESNWTLQLAGAYRLDSWMDAAQLDTFERGGYYAVRVSPAVELIVLNIDYLCLSHTPDTSDVQDPDGQFAWLEFQLASLRTAGRKAIVQGHMPPGAGRGGSQNLWSSYEATLVALLADYADVLLCVLMGHSHRETFRMIRDANHDVVAFIVLTGALSPIDNNNPTFRYYSWGDGDTLPERLADFRTYYLDLKHATDPGSAQWQLAYQFSEAFDIQPPDLNATAIHEVYKKIVCDKTYTAKFADFYQSFRGVDYTKEDEKHWFCSMNHPLYDDYRACMKDDVGLPRIHC